MNREDTTFLRFVAICLILNSHLDLYYPIPYIGTGGALGNALFFMLSSFGLFLSEKKRPQSFTIYFTKRIRRIYPSVWIVLFVLVLPIHISQSKSDAEFIIIFLSKFLYPSFWFIQALLIYYLIGFFLIKRYSQKKIIFAMTVGSLAYLVFYLTYLDLTKFSIESMPFKILFYNIVFMLGVFLSSIEKKINYTNAGDIIICFVSVLIIYGHKYFMSIDHLENLQILQHILTLIVVIYALKLSRSTIVKSRIMKLPVVGDTIKYISQITLELYLVHITISPIILKKNIPFPFNILIFLFATFSIAAMINLVVSKFIFFTSTRWPNVFR